MCIFLGFVDSVDRMLKHMIVSSEQFRDGGSSALVVIRGAPAFNIPLLLANALHRSLAENNSSSVGLSSLGLSPTFFDQQGLSVPNGLQHYTQVNHGFQLGM